MTEDWKNGGFGLYIHWPFCEAKCPYCDFNSHVSREIDQSRWLRAYLQELDRVAEDTPDRVLNTVFFGGGTPSLMEPDVVAAILERVRRLWPTSNDMEVTLEANPGSVEATRFRGYRQGGVNRISMGIQALNNHDLKKLGRIHSVEEAIAAFDIARDTFDRVSFDLIYARQDQTLKQWEAELEQALSMAIDHLSLYQLTVEEGTAFGDRYERGKLRGLPADDLAADMYEMTEGICKEHGFEAYEVSNYAKPGYESRHNQIYWRYGDYAGIGPGAHARMTINGVKYAVENWRNPERWLSAVQDGTGENVRDIVDPEGQSIEFLLMGLRLNEGIDLSRYEGLAGHKLNEAKVDALREMGMIYTENQRLKVKPKGRMVLNAVLSELLVD
ncbi:radical SAM family heme chaperone HemW [Shimia thalassica]|uniref:radical SAM family heme chaperone HemW n=1 Tax=Shimia thalassica TaxID=1715693 RepID=UPI001C082FEA|nr:radical SAM family heme chaperone HemW [Shimia thalassica]MBU2945033.1 radical SAM family heme chaperone HemW [Shimia thalassica]MDO6504659.1 radical SAM family heme chaperone HemW [Shimia thalassica]